MTERKITYRSELVGGQQVESGFVRMGDAGFKAYERIDRGQKSAKDSANVLLREIDREERAFRALKASIDPAYAAQRRFEQAQEQVNRAVRLGVVTQQDAARVMQQLQLQARGTAAAMEMVDTATVRGGNGMRNALLQVNQIGQQTAATGQLMTAVAIQLPDILAGFGGILPLVLGAAAGLGAAFIPRLFEAEEAAEDLRGTLESAYSSAERALDAARDAQDRYTTAIRLSGRAQTSVTEEILSGLHLELEGRKALAEYESLMLERRMMQVQEALRADQERLAAIRASALQPADDALDFLYSQAEQTGRLDQAAVADALAARAQLEREVLKNNEDLVFEIKRQEAEIKVVNGQLLITQRASEEIDAGMKRAADQGERFSLSISTTDLSVISGQAAFLAQQMGVAASAAVQYNNALNRSAGLGGAPAQGGLSFGLGNVDLGLQGNNFERLGYGNLNLPPVRAITPLPEPPKRTRGGGGGGATSESNRLDSEALRIRRANVTAQERFNQEMALANTLLETGRLTTEEYNRHVAATKDAYRQATEGTKTFQRYTTMTKDAVINAVMGQAGAFDQLKASIARAIVEFAIFRTVAGQPVDGLGGLFSAILGGLPSFDGGGWTGDGPRSGGLDGRGGMLAVVHPQEQINDRYREGPRATRGEAGGWIPFVGLGDGVQVQWLREADARSAAQLGHFANLQRQNIGNMQNEYALRGTL